MEKLLVKNVYKTYHSDIQEKFQALSDINLCINKGENLSIVGESGCGKSTLARLLVGIEKPTSGNIFIDGEDCTNWNYQIWRKHRRKIQAVFQDATGTLNPVRTAYHNVEEGLINLTDCSAKERRNRIYELMEAVHMERKLLETPVRQLSGGEQRRLALLRAIAVKPDYLILDEVTSGLDVISAEAVLYMLENFINEYNCSCIFITHDRDSAMRISERIIVMQSGRIAKQGRLINQISRRD